MSKNTKLVGLLCICLLGLSACGQKGPLSLPPEPASNQTPDTPPSVQANQQEPR